MDGQRAGEYISYPDLFLPTAPGRRGVKIEGSPAFSKTDTHT